MCGRFTLSLPWEVVSKRFGVGVPEEINTPYYNAAPGQQLAAIVKRENLQAELMNWGIPLSYSEKNQPVINARAESINTKPLFREKLFSSRCLIPADGFYEWEKQKDKKQPFRFVLKDKGLFAFAGLFGSFKTPLGSSFNAFVIITTSANKLVSEVHNRMPVMFSPENAVEWLLNDNFGTDIQNLRAFNPVEMIKYKVSPKVNSTSNDSAELLKQWTDPGLTLF